MKTLARLAMAVLVVVAVAAVLVFWMRPRSSLPQPDTLPAAVVAVADDNPPAPTDPLPVVPPLLAPNDITSNPAEPPQATNRLDRLDRIRQAFRTLAAGDKTNALRAARQLTDENEREAALLTLALEWTQGELGPARLRAARIANFGLEAGIGLELAKHPELALLWADELTEGNARAVLLQSAAGALLASDPAAAFALAQRLPDANRSGFTEGLYQSWAGRDTEAALRWAEQRPDAAERDAALSAIRSAAPVGIGAVLQTQDGYPVIRELVAGTPAERSGQLRAGDRIVAIAQGGGSFVDVNEMPLANVVEAIRGQPGTWLQLQVISPDAPPQTPPRVVLIMRDQIKFKR